MGLESQKPERLGGHREGAESESIVILDVTRQTLLSRKWQQDLGLGPDMKRSDNALVEQYEFLLHSAHFRPLARLVTSDEQIILEDSSDVPGQPEDYDAYKHCIRVPLKTKDGIARPLADVRAALLFEIHNAYLRGLIERTNRLDPPDLSPDSSAKEKEFYPFRMAGFALSCEWGEWIHAIECHLRIRAINADPKMGEGRQHVRECFGARYAKFDQRWYKFSKYIEEQIEGKHTLDYDPEAAKPDWVGKHILAVVQARYPASLIITQKQVRDWQNGIRRRVKSPSNNPFISPTIIPRAMKASQGEKPAKADSEGTGDVIQRVDKKRGAEKAGDVIQRVDKKRKTE